MTACGQLPDGAHRHAAAEDCRDGQDAAGLAEAQRYVVSIRITVLDNLVPGGGMADIVAFFRALVSRATDKRRPDALGVPNLLHVGTRRGFAHGKHVAAIAAKEGGHPVVRDAMDVNRDFF